MQSLLAPTRLCPSKSFLALQAKGNTHSGSDIGYHGNSADSSSLLGEWSSVFAPFPDSWDFPPQDQDARARGIHLLPFRDLDPGERYLLGFRGVSRVRMCY